MRLRNAKVQLAYFSSASAMATTAVALTLALSALPRPATTPAAGASYGLRPRTQYSRAHTSRIRAVEDDDVAAFRKKLLAQLADDDATTKPPPPSDAGAKVSILSPSQLAPGTVLLANPKRFCSRNPLARPVDDLNRFGLAGPVAVADRDQLSADLAAQMLPVVLVLEHSAAGGTTGVLLERRTGALMGDVSMEDFGCVAISPLWLGGIERQETLKIVHTCGDEVASAAPLGGERPRARRLGGGAPKGGWLEPCRVALQVLHRIDRMGQWAARARNAERGVVRARRAA